MSNKIAIVFTKDTGHGRTGDVDLINGYECDRCKENVVLLAFDCSEGEYDWIKLCRSCINVLFDDHTGYNG